jgi:DNA-binding CsgD family transcriptional regulator
VNIKGERALDIRLDERKLSIIVHSLFSSWMLAFLFEGQILYALAGQYEMVSINMVFEAIAALFVGLLTCGILIKNKKAARRLFLYSYIFFIAASAAFFFPPGVIWTIGIVASSFLAGGCVAAWGFYFKSGTPKQERIKTAADVLIFSNILMILLNMAAIHLSPHVGLALSMLMLLCAFLFALRLPIDKDLDSTAVHVREEESRSIAKPLALLSLFIVVITINSGLMYQVINPAFAHYEWLTSWYWAVPYIVAIYVMRNLPRRINRTYILYGAIAMIGFSFIAFAGFDRSVINYLIVNTLMLGACGIYDLFWWSILGEMLSFHKNAAKVFGIGLAANVLGVLLGGIIGQAIYAGRMSAFNSTLLALAVVCVTLTLLPPLHRHLSLVLTDHTYLMAFYEMSAREQTSGIDQTSRFDILSERESQVATLLLQGKTYRKIAGELYISENTVKYYVKSIYSKFNVQSRAELIDIILEKEKPAAPQ